jgi:L-2-hydroxyglutarate oxidase LhgO
MQILVIGAGVVGLAVARAAALGGHEVIVAEAGNAIGTGISSRNSEVIHAGMYYQTGSRRAFHCPRGNRMLYDFCVSHGVPHRRCGKLIVATNEPEKARIAQIEAQGVTNGLKDLQLLDRQAAREMEPALSCIAALWSPSTGIVDAHSYMLAMQGDIEDRGGVIALETPVTRMSSDGKSWQVHFGGSEPGMLTVDAVINCAGLSAQNIARNTEGYPTARIPRLFLAKGNYFSYSGRPVFSRLIYPTPVDGGLGVHVTIDRAGRMRFGPDVEWVETENYEVDPSRADSFYARIRLYWPELPDNTLIPDYSGIRPKLSGPNEPIVDFLIDSPADHAMPGLINLFGIESPGLTSSLSLAEEVMSYLD